MTGIKGRSGCVVVGCLNICFLVLTLLPPMDSFWPFGLQLLRDTARPRFLPGLIIRQIASRWPTPVSPSCQSPFHPISRSNPSHFVLLMIHLAVANSYFKSTTLFDTSPPG